MSIEVMAWAWDLPSLSPGARLVLLVLADLCDRTGYAEVDRGYISDRTSQTPETVQKRVDELERLGHVERHRDGVRILHIARVVLPPALDDPDRRALRDERIRREMDERRLDRPEPSAEERERVRSKAEATKRALDATALDAGAGRLGA